MDLKDQSPMVDTSIGDIDLTNEEKSTAMSDSDWENSQKDQGNNDKKKSDSNGHLVQLEPELVNSEAETNIYSTEKEFEVTQIGSLANADFQEKPVLNYLRHKSRLFDQQQEENGDSLDDLTGSGLKNKLGMPAEIPGRFADKKSVIMLLFYIFFGSAMTYNITTIAPSLIQGKFGLSLIETADLVSHVPMIGAMVKLVILPLIVYKGNRGVLMFIAT